MKYQGTVIQGNSLPVLGFSPATLCSVASHFRYSPLRGCRLPALNSSGDLEVVPLLSLPSCTYKSTGLYIKLVFLPHDRPSATCSPQISSEASDTKAFQLSEAALVTWVRGVSVLGGFRFPASEGGL